MSIAPLLELFDDLPLFEQLIDRINNQDDEGLLLPLELTKSTRPPVLAQLFRRSAEPRQAP
ncbi:MAG: hypothetical protein R3C44_07690 [Chloroflexota bacterium]